MSARKYDDNINNHRRNIVGSRSKLNIVCSWSVQSSVTFDIRANSLGGECLHGCCLSLEVIDRNSLDC